MAASRWTTQCCRSPWQRGGCVSACCHWKKHPIWWRGLQRSRAASKTCSQQVGRYILWFCCFCKKGQKGGGEEACESLCACVPAGTHTYENAAQLLHITVFHFSRPDDPRPVSTSLNDSDAITAMPILQRPGATSKEIARERDLLSDLVTRAQHISGLQVKRHLDWLCYTQHVRYFCMQRQAGALASTGAQRGHGNQRDAAAFVHRAGARHCKPAQPFAQQSARLGAPLLVPLPCMTTRDSLSCRDCRLHTALHACTGAPRKQAAILHSTLLRILTPRQLEPDVIAAIQEQCQRWTQQLRGTTLSITRAW